MLARPGQNEADSGPHRAAPATARLCVVTREVKPIDEMIRFVVGPDRAVVPDLKRRLPGRGVWVTARRDVLAQAVRRGAFRRAFRGDVNVAPDLADTVDALLERAVLEALAIARKAGQAVTGHAKVMAAAENGTATAVLHAREARADGARRTTAALRRGHASSGGNVVFIEAFTSTQLDLALARPNVVHAALLAGRASETVLARWGTLARYRMGSPSAADRIELSQAAGSGSEAESKVGSESRSE